MKQEYVCAGIVTYNPDIKLLIEDIRSIYCQVNEIIIVDNGSDNYSNIQRSLEELKLNIHIKHNDDNKGIAKALNQIFEIAKIKKYLWVYTLDQDTLSDKNMISKLSKCITRDTAIIAPNIVYKDNEILSSKDINNIEEVSWVITSGSLTSVLAWENVNGFDEKLFIDGVDFDFCYRLRKNGYKIKKNFSVEIIHELGELRCVRVFGKVLYVTNHSPIRKYYMSRNVIYLDYKLGLSRRVNYIAKIILKVVFFERKKIKSLKCIKKGIKDGRIMKNNNEKRVYA